MQYLFSGSLLILFGNDPQLGLCTEFRTEDCDYFNLEGIPVKSLGWIYCILIV